MSVRIGQREATTAPSSRPPVAALSLTPLARQTDAQPTVSWRVAAPIPAPQATLARALAGHVKPARRAPAAAATPEHSWLIEDLVLGPGRSQGAFGSAEMRHTTAWQVSVDTIRSAVVSQPVATGVANAVHLINAVKQMPGAGYVGNFDTKARKNYDEALKAADAALGQAAAPSLATLRALVSGFLRLRNALPLSAVDAGDRATGSGEAGTTAYLRQVDANPAGASPDQVRLAIAALFDDKTTNTIGAGGATLGTMAMQPAGQAVGAAAGQVAGDMREQHRQSIKLAYPAAYALAYPADTVRTAPAQRTANPASDGDVSASVTLGNDGKISQLIAVGRPPTSLATGQGSHTIAFTLHVAVLRRMVEGKTPAVTMRAVRQDLTTHAADAQRVAAMPDRSKDRYNEAQRAAQTATAYANDRNGDAQAQLEQLCIAWLAHRNAQPLSAVLKDIANGAGEGTTNKKLFRLNNKRDLSAMRELQSELNEIGWGLIDHDAVKAVKDASRPKPPAAAAPPVTTRSGRTSKRPAPPKYLPPLQDSEMEEALESDPDTSVKLDFPGMTANAIDDVATLVGRYLDEMRVGYPTAFERLKLRSAHSVAWFLSTKCGFVRDDVIAIADELGVNGVDVQLGGGQTSRNDDEDSDRNNKRNAKVQARNAAQAADAPAPRRYVHVRRGGGS